MPVEECSSCGDASSSDGVGGDASIRGWTVELAYDRDEPTEHLREFPSVVVGAGPVGSSLADS